MNNKAKYNGKEVEVVAIHSDPYSFTLKHGKRFKDVNRNDEKLELNKDFY